MPLKSAHDKSVLDTCSLSSEQLLSIFDQADELQDLKAKHGVFYRPTDGQSRPPGRRVVSCLFLEPSTRTRMSFEMAAFRLGHDVQRMDSSGASSLSKGETFTDTVLNVLAMKPDALVIRYGNSEELDRLLPTLEIPVLNAGSGVTSHPTQAMLDAYTIRNHFKTLQGQRVLIVGDILHSRVARSNFDVLTKLGAEVAICGPDAFLPTAKDVPAPIRVFRDLDQALPWASVYMGLRIQLERHGDYHLDHDTPSMKTVPSVGDDYNARFGLNRARLQTLSKDAIILHPGPINHGVEFTADVLMDPRGQILKQVENGVLIRGVLLRNALS